MTTYNNPGGPIRPAPLRSGGPPSKSVEYYVNKHINPELVDEIAESQAKELLDIAPTQLRRFYEDVLTLRRRLEVAAGQAQLTPAAAFDALRVDFKMLKAKAHYAVARNLRLKPLKTFFDLHVPKVTTAQDFHIFCKHFEAVIAFHKFFKEGDR